MFLQFEIRGDRIVHEILQGQSGERVRSQLAQIIQSSLKNQVQSVVERWAEERSHEVDYDPELTVSIKEDHPE